MTQTEDMSLLLLFESFKKHLPEEKVLHLLNSYFGTAQEVPDKSPLPQYTPPAACTLGLDHNHPQLFPLSRLWAH